MEGWPFDSLRSLRTFAESLARHERTCGSRERDAGESNGGEAGIRTLDTGFGPYNGLANRRLQPLGHLTAKRILSINDIAGYGKPIVPKTVPEIVPASDRRRRPFAVNNVDEDLENRQRFFSEPSISATHSAAGVCSPKVAMRSPVTEAIAAAPKRAR